MYADRAQQRRMSPTGLTMAVGINGALLAALIFSAPDLPKIVHYDPLTTENIPIPPDPPPPEPQPKKSVDTPADTHIVAPKPITDLPRPPVEITGTIDLPPIPDIGMPAGTGTGTATVDPPKPLPVMTGAEVDPRYADQLQPDFPTDMRRAGREGRVVVKVLIGTDGRVKAIEAVQSPSDSFFAATRRQALGHWRFKPATRDGVPYESWKTMSLLFRLEG